MGSRPHVDRKRAGRDWAAQLLLESVGDRESYENVKNGKLPVLAEAFLRVEQKKLRDRAALVFVRRIQGRELRKRWWKVV